MTVNKAHLRTVQPTQMPRVPQQQEEQLENNYNLVIFIYKKKSYSRDGTNGKFLMKSCDIIN
jgi:hypothetical protein